MQLNTIIPGDCLNVLPTLEANSIDACVTDPPYALTGASRNGSPRTNDAGTPFGRHNLQPKGFMGLQWDGELPGIPHWKETLRVLKPGGYMLAFGGTRTWHRLACAVEDAGFEIRDTIAWLYGSGFPKGKGCLKPAFEPIIVCRKPGPKVLPLGVDECRIGENAGWSYPNGRGGKGCFGQAGLSRNLDVPMAATAGRWPANIVHDGSEEVLAAFAEFGENKGDGYGKPRNRKPREDETQYRIGGGRFNDTATYTDSGTAARFFYCAKASRKERGEGTTHPTVKPLALVEWLVKLVARPGEIVLDPFLGSGTTALACLRTDRKFIGIEREASYVSIAENRLAKAREELGLFAETEASA